MQFGPSEVHERSKEKLLKLQYLIGIIKKENKEDIEEFIGNRDDLDNDF